MTAYLARHRPTHERELVIDVRSAPDDLGRSMFVVHRLGYNPSTGEAMGHRAQVFFTDLDAFIRSTASWEPDRRPLVVTTMRTAQ